MNDTYVTVVGNVVDSPRLVRLDNGAVTNFRMASTAHRLGAAQRAGHADRAGGAAGEGSADHPCFRATGVRPSRGRVDCRARTAFVRSGFQPLTYQGPIQVVQHIK